MSDLVLGAEIRAANKVDKIPALEKMPFWWTGHVTHLGQTISPQECGYQTPYQDSGLAIGEEWGEENMRLSDSCHLTFTHTPALQPQSDYTTAG